MASVFYPPHPNNMTDSTPSHPPDDDGGTDADTGGAGTGPADAVPVGGWTADQDDLPDFNALGDSSKASPS